jgi:hypothetical protein
MESGHAHGDGGRGCLARYAITEPSVVQQSCEWDRGSF